MWPYFLMFLVPALLAMSERPLAGGHVARVQNPVTFIGWLFTALILLALVGLRFQVGGDWGSYLLHFLNFEEMNFADAVKYTDFGFAVINYVSAQVGAGITGVNFVVAGIFVVGLISFCRDLPRPWLAVAVAIPYLVIVVGMGYSRQATAIALILISFSALSRSRYIWFVFWVLCAAMFHKTAVIMLPIAVLTVSNNKFLIRGSLILFGAIAYFVILRDSVDDFLSSYIDSDYQSSGAFIRLAMNAVPAALFLLLRKRFTGTEVTLKLWTIMSILALSTFVAFFFTNASTALDRMGLYIIPLQLFVFSKLPATLSSSPGVGRFISICIVVYYLAVLVTWLNFATHSRYWIPYTMSF